MLIETRSAALLKAAATNLVTADFTTTPLIPTVTKPVASATKAVLAWGNAGHSYNSLMFTPYGSGADNATFSARVTGWRSISAIGLTTLWVPTRLMELSCLLSTSVGIAAAAVINTERFCDTITQVASTAMISTVEIYSPADNSPGWVLADGLGFELIEFTVDLGTATDANFLVGTL